MKEDYFEHKLAEKLKDSEMSPPTDLWQRLEHTLDATPATMIQPKRRKFTTLLVGATAIAAALLLSFLLINTEKENLTVTKMEVSAVDNTSDNKTVPEIPKIDIKNTSTNLIGQITSSKSTNKKAIIAAVSSKHVIETNENIKSSEMPISEQNEEEEATSSKSTRSVATSYNTPSQRTYLEMTGNVRRKKSNGLILTISGNGAFGSASSVANKDMFAANIRDMNGNRPLLYEKAEKTVNWEHTIPISISTTVQKMFTKRIGIETGLTYTYLSSHANVDKKPRIDVKQRLHYLGVPISIVYNIAETNNLNFYAKGGFLVDKAISTEYKTYLDNKITTDKLDSQGVQWTSSLQVGAEYEIGKLVSLYVEPTVNYYFKSKQPESYRTENDFGFSVTLGVRFKL